MFRFNYVFIFITLLLMNIAACNSGHSKMTVKITNTITTSTVSSGSALAAGKGILYIVGDDAEYLGMLPANGKDFARLDLYPGAPQERISKPLKHDLEAGTWGVIGADTFLIAFGSGGISPYRDTLFAINPDNPEKNFKHSLHDLYKAISVDTGLKATELNIEGATIAGDKLFLLNRGKNLCIVLSWKEFARYIKRDEDQTLPSFAIVPVSLPVVNNFPIGFSGVCTLNEHQLLFTASLEETTDYIQDGAVKGSYIGVLDVSGDSVVVWDMVALNDMDGKSVLDKLESIEILDAKNGQIKAVAVADNDDGSSRLIYLDIVIPQR